MANQLFGEAKDHCNADAQATPQECCRYNERADQQCHRAKRLSSLTFMHTSNLCTGSIKADPVGSTV